MLIKFTKNNIQKIKNGIKTCTCRNYKIPDGIYEIDGSLKISLNGYYYNSIYHMNDHEKWAIAEGFDSWEDMYKNCIFQHTRDFMDGYTGMWIYKITVQND